MLTIHIKKKPFKIPTSWNEVMFKDYVSMCKGKYDGLQVVSLFTGIEYDILRKSEIIGLDSLLERIRFIFEPIELDGVCTQLGPYKLPINSKKKFDIQFESLAQFEDMRSVMYKVPDGDAVGLTEAYPKFCAIYLQKIRDREYDYQKALVMVPEIEGYPMPDVMTMGSFFLIKLLRLSNGTVKASPQQKKIPKRNKQAGHNSMKRSARTRK